MNDNRSQVSGFLAIMTLACLMMGSTFVWLSCASKSRTEAADKANPNELGWFRVEAKPSLDSFTRHWIISIFDTRTGSERKSFCFAPALDDRTLLGLKALSNAEINKIQPGDEVQVTRFVSPSGQETLFAIGWRDPHLHLSKAP